MKKTILLVSLFFGNINTMNHVKSVKAMYFYNTILGLYCSNDIWDQLTFNELWYKNRNKSHEIWPEQLSDVYHQKLNSLKLIDSVGNPKPEVSGIINSLVVLIKENDNRQYLFINPLQRTILCKSSQLKKQIGTYVLLKLLCKKNINHECFEKAVLW